MKKILTVFVALLLVVSCTPFAFADSNTSENANYTIPVVIDQPYDPFSANGLRGDSIPTTVYSLENVSYSGQATFSSSVYTNCLFSNHHGTIMLYISSSDPYVSDPDLELTVWLCRKNWLGNEIVVQTKHAPVNGYAQLMYSGLDVNTNYFFHICQSYNSEGTTSYFTVGRLY